MKNNQPPASIHTIRTLLPAAFLFVFSSALVFIVCINYTTFSFNLLITNRQFSPVPDNSPFSTYISQNPTETVLYGVSPPPAVMNDAELLRWASLDSKNKVFRLQRPPKLAFMFLTRGAVVLAPLWEKFFKGYEEKFSIYVHSDPSFNGSESVSKSSVFLGRRIPSKRVDWGNVNMVEAERRLLANALLDTSNQYFILLSETCIPLYNFSTIYSYVLNSTQNFIESYDAPGRVARGRYSPKMSPTIELKDWRKGSQWFAVDRKLAVEIVSDKVYFPIFRRYCNGSCYADEHYLPTLVSMKFGARNANRTLTWVDWSKGGRHPFRFFRSHVTPEFLETMRTGARCEYNGRETDVCYLFARKFTEHSLGRLLILAPRVMHFNR